MPKEPFGRALLRELAPGHAAETDLRRIELADAVHVLRTMTVEIGKLRSQIVNDVLTSERLALDATGQAFREFRVPFGSVSVANHSGHPIVLHGGGPQASAPGTGAGVHVIPAGVQRVVNVAHHVLTLYGAPAGEVSLEVFTRPQPPTSGPALTAVTAADAALTSVAGVAVATQLLPANAARRGAFFFNESPETLYLGYCAVADLTVANYTMQIRGGGLYVMDPPIYPGVISGLWTAAGSAVRITEQS